MALLQECSKRRMANSGFPQRCYGSICRDSIETRGGLATAVTTASSQASTFFSKPKLSISLASQSFAS
jgi:hypothetical protein